MTNYELDSRRAAHIFIIAALLFILFAWTELVRWPGKFFFEFLLNPSIVSFYNAFNGYFLIINVIFWATRPSIRSQYVVFFAWPFLIFVLVKLFDGKIPVDFFNSNSSGVGFVSLLSMAMAIPASIGIYTDLQFRRYQSFSNFDINKIWLIILTVLFALVPQSALDLTVSLHPKTYDSSALYFDISTGLNISPKLTDLVHQLPGVSQIIGLAYGFTPLAFLAVCLLQLRYKPIHVPTALLLWMVMTLCALLAFHIFPITGPKYIFGPDHFIAKLRTLQGLPLPMEMTTSVGPNARNGMPSMHFGWMLAATILWCRLDTKLVSRLVFTFMTACVAIATLYLGEHYTIDLIVAVPFVLGAISLTSTGLSWRHRQRWLPIILGFGCWLVWVILLRRQITFFIDHSWAGWVLIGATVVVVWWQVQVLAQYRHLTILSTKTPLVNELQPLPDQSMQIRTKRMGLMFFASGAAALVYQVLFAKELALVFGSTATATFTVLATFLGGMAIGSLIGGYVAARVRRPLVCYAFVELAIGAFCVLTPVLFSALQGAYVYLAADLPADATALLVLRIGLGAGVLLLPTMLMGITLPLLVQALNSQRAGMGKAVAWLYACNTAGAALGALLTSYFVIPLLGAHSTTLIAALLNLLVALGALELAKSAAPLLAQRPAVDALVPTLASAPVPPDAHRHLVIALCVLGFGGVLSLGLEVVYVHMLSVVAGNSVYAFGLMLTTFLLGLAGGGEVGRRLLVCAVPQRLLWLALVQLALALTVILGSWGWDQIPAYFASYAGYPVATSFASREAIRALVCALVMLAPTLCIGASYTLAMDIATATTARKAIHMVGWGAAANTFGNISGVVLFGFFLLPSLGGLGSAKVVAIGALLLAASIATFALQARVKPWLYAALAAAVSLLGLSPAKLDYAMLSSGANVYFVAQNWGQVIDHAESIDGGLTTVTRQKAGTNSVTTLLTNGKFQGNDARNGEVQAQIGFAALPLLHQAQRDNALIIGYGTGGTSRVFHDAGFAHIDIAELSRDVVALANAHFWSINKRVADLPGVQTHITDGRNLLLLTKKRYDIISIEITSIWFAGAASLYNREFYQLARSKMMPDGVLQQWVQLHHMTPSDLLTIVSTLRSEFSFVSLYVVGGQGILIATNSPTRSQPSVGALNALDAAVQLQGVRDLAGRSFAKIADDLLLSPRQIDTFIDKFGLNRDLWISTDNNMRLEYSTPKANAAPPDRSFEINMNLLHQVRN